MEELKQKRQRVLDAYFDGIVPREEMNRRLKQIDKDEAFFQDLLLRAEPVPPGVSVEDLASAFSPFFEWEFLSREQKRRLLQATVPEIHVWNYRINGLSLLTDRVYRDEITRTDRSSWPKPA